jgi:phenol hydroxylase P0 protein
MPTTPEITTPDVAAEPVCDLSRKFVRVLREQPDGLVAFEFAIGWPDLAVELAMPRPMFEEFCRRQQVERLPDDAASPTLGDAARENEGNDA